jgi:hypothetical protein
VRRCIVSFSGARYYCTTKKIVEEGPKFGATEVMIYDDHWLLNIHPTYRDDARWLLDHPSTRGVGWFAWKSFVALDALKRVGPDDVVLMIDADTYPISDLSVLFDITARDGTMIFRANGWQAIQWMKRSAYKIMGQDEEKYWHVPHGCARFVGLTHRSRPLLEEWKKYCLIPDCTTFDPSPPEYGPEHPEFKQSRCEQAILTNLGHKYGHRFYREACQFGEGVEGDALLDRDLYPQLFVQEYGQTYAPGFDQFNPGHGSTFRNILD